MRDEDQRDWIEETFRFEQKRAKFQLFLAQLEWSELNLIAEDVKRMCDYKAKTLETESLNRAWLNERGLTTPPLASSLDNISPMTYAPYKKLVSEEDVA